MENHLFFKSESQVGCWRPWFPEAGVTANMSGPERRGECDVGWDTQKVQTRSPDKGHEGGV